jgi:N-acetylmuramoyl-L-alanine amidase
MTELNPGETDGLEGIYSGIVKIRSLNAKSLTPIKIELKGKGGKVRAYTPGKVGILSGQVPGVGETVTETKLWNASTDGSILNTIPSGVRLHITGKFGDRYRIKLATNHTAFVSIQSVKLRPAGTPLPRTPLSSPTIESFGEWVRLKMNVRTRCPFTMEQSLDPPAIELAVFGAHLSGQWTSYPINNEIIKIIRKTESGSDVFKLRVELNLKQQWGFRTGYRDDYLYLDIRKPPILAQPPASPVKGLTIALDPGHGGDDLGAISPTGLIEKNVNLALAKNLKNLLDSASAKVIMTRTEDSAITLKERMEIARRANARIFLMLHNNSIGVSSNPLAVRGASTYFTIPQNQALAWKVYPHLLDLGLSPFGRIQSSYYITRQTDMLILLVEGAFLSNPEDEMQLMDPEFLKKMAGAVFTGLEDFLNQTRSTK